MVRIYSREDGVCTQNYMIDTAHIKHKFYISAHHVIMAANYPFSLSLYGTTTYVDRVYNYKGS